MATRMHTAGIYSDMTVDGPEIGTLVLIIDRAKNLPNRKSIGKQDPYCAARLGKEAKKTGTDRRGGQTPRWDQELRFTVHDSPDYYQLKVSVFNDDKKTEIIGETWVNLQEVVIPGGGQSDIWHTLSCKGKYAGEIRIEITYYDTRPKPEKPEKIKEDEANGLNDESRNSLKGPRQLKAHVKRRPLPSDPVTGAPAPIPDYDQLPPRGNPLPQAALPGPIYTPSCGHQNLSQIAPQSPLRSVENSTQPRFFRSQEYGDSPNLNGYRSNITAASPIVESMSSDIYEIHDPRNGNEYSQNDEHDYYGHEHHQMGPSDHYRPGQAPYELPQPHEYGTPPSPGGPPPPPPAHRIRNGSQNVSPAPSKPSHDSYGCPSNTRKMNQFHPPSSDTQRHSMSSYSQTNSYHGYSPTREEDQFRRSANGYEKSPPGHRSYDSRYNGDYNGDYTSMQPTVEDVTPTSSPAGHSQQSIRDLNFQHDEHRYDQVPSPGPLHINSRISSSPGRKSASNNPSYQLSNNSLPNESRNSPILFRDSSQTRTLVTSRTSFNSRPQQAQPQRRRSEDPMTGSLVGYGLPQVPPTLVAGVDPGIVREISDRIHQEKKENCNPGGGNSPRHRHDSLQHEPNRPHPLSYHETAGLPIVPAAATYDEPQSQYPTTTNAPIVKPRAISPDPRTPSRKSVSPSREPTERMRLSQVPYGPDSYNAFNPSLATSKSDPSLGPKYDPNEVDPDAKIITHDGREIDPSDHIPESNYAPLHEARGAKYASQLPDRNYRPPTSLGQALTASVRTPLRHVGRPKSMVSSSLIYMNAGFADPSTTQSGRNRLQKKANRMSAQHAPHPSPLAPITPCQDNSFVPKSLPNLNTRDHSNENYFPQNLSLNPGYRDIAGPPPLQPKVSVDIHSSLPPQPSGANAWALLEEIKNIDLGSIQTGRKRL